jgi:hypothetical protein
LYSSSMSSVCAQHILFALEQVMGKDKTNIGREKIVRLRENSIMFRRRLIELGIQVYGDPGSPVIPIMLYPPAKIAAFSRECLARGLAVVVVGFPATPLLLSRARICLSAAHTKEDLEYALHVIEQVAELIQIKYNSKKMIEMQLEEEEQILKAAEERRQKNTTSNNNVNGQVTKIEENTRFQSFLPSCHQVLHGKATEMLDIQWLPNHMEYHHNRPRLAIDSSY